MIPKIIHFTWFGKDPYPQIVEKCIASWHKFLPDYEIKLWNADNFDLNINKWVSQACAAKKYAFAADYARVYLLYTYGGIYLDSDILILRSLDPLLRNKAFTSFVPSTLKKNYLEGEIIGSNAGHPFFKTMMEYYEGRDFVLNDGKYDMKPITEIIYEMLLSAGMRPDNTEQDVMNVHVYPSGYFLWSCHDVTTHMNEQTAYSIHFGRFSWRDTDGLFIKLLVPILDYYREHELGIWKNLKRFHIDKLAYYYYISLRKWRMKQ